MKLAEIPEILNLTMAEKIVLVEDLWDSILENRSEILVLDSHKFELKRRFKKYKNLQVQNLFSLNELQKRMELRK